MLPFGLQLKTFEPLRHFPMNLEKFDFEREIERNNKIFGIIKVKQDSKKNKKREKKNSTMKNKN